MAAGSRWRRRRSPVDEALLARGAERYGIYCKPCHDERGEGKGILFERAKVPTANLLDQQIREQSDEQIFDTITNGKGLMASYRYPVTARGSLGDHRLRARPAGGDAPAEAAK